jgi:hypothetical protein
MSIGEVYKDSLTNNDISDVPISTEILNVTKVRLTLNLLTTTIVAPPSNDSKWQMGFNSAFKGLKIAEQFKVMLKIVKERCEIAV